MIANFEAYRAEYMKLWYQCMAAGYTTVDARSYAEMELAERLKKIRTGVGVKVAIQPDAKKDKV